MRRIEAQIVIGRKRKIDHMATSKSGGYNKQGGNESDILTDDFFQNLFLLTHFLVSSKRSPDTYEE